MGYGYYVLADGREAGYNVEATCDLDGCEKKIDRGLGYLCGREPGGSKNTCGDYFCESHLFMGGPCQMCERCLDAWERAERLRRLARKPGWKVTSVRTDTLGVVNAS